MAATTAEATGAATETSAAGLPTEMTTSEAAAPPATAAPTEAETLEATASQVETQAAPQLTEAAPEATAAVGATAESAAATFADIEMALSSFPVAESGIGEVDTSLGNTLLVTVCTTPGRAMRTLLPQVMNALAKESLALGTTVAALGVRMLDCGANSPLLTVVVDLTTAQSYAQGALTDTDFAAAWKPQ
jgi:hypothetical protein